MSTKNTQLKQFLLFWKIANFRVLQFYPLKMNLVLEIRLVLTPTTAGVFFLDPLLYYKQPPLWCTASTGLCTS